MPKFKHGYRGSTNKSPEYNAWDRMKARCYNQKYKNYKNYGAKGVTVCDRWRNSFENFLADMGERPSKGHSLDRYPDKYGNYEPGNCRWATFVEQQRNRTNNTLLTYKGQTKTIVEWSEITGINSSTLSNRIRSCGWTVDRALSTKPKRA